LLFKSLKEKGEIMKKYCSIIALLCILAAGLCYADNTNNVKQTSGIMLSKSNPVYTLQLASNPTTGYSWYIVSYDDNLLELTSHAFQAPKKGMIGAGGTEAWKFKATDAAFQAPCFTTIKMIYARPWELTAGKYADKDIKNFYVVIQ
jgi:inhibitor of cysteine peptidase